VLIWIRETRFAAEIDGSIALHPGGDLRPDQTLSLAANKEGEMLKADAGLAGIGDQARIFAGH
jgi:hypothetical protein